MARGHRILVVEADAMVAQALQRVLSALGYAPVTAASCAAARAMRGRFAAGVFGRLLRDGDGIELARELQASGRVDHAVFFLFKDVGGSSASTQSLGHVVQRPDLGLLLRKLDEVVLLPAPLCSAGPASGTRRKSTVRTPPRVPYQVVERADGGFVEVRHVGVITIEDCRAARFDAAALMRESGIRRLLVDLSQATLAYSLFDLHQLCSEHTMVLPLETLLAIIATEQTAPWRHLRFGEAVATRNGTCISAFEDQESALGWLEVELDASG